MTNADKMDKLFNEYVPSTGAAATVAGEIVRAVSRIEYRYYNDGDMLGAGYGNETCNPAARYLLSLNIPRITKIINMMWDGEIRHGGCSAISDDEYVELLNSLISAVLEEIEGNPELKTTCNRDDMWNHSTSRDKDPGEDW